MTDPRHSLTILLTKKKNRNLDFYTALNFLNEYITHYYASLYFPLKNVPLKKSNALLEMQYTDNLIITLCATLNIFKKYSTW